MMLGERAMTPLDMDFYLKAHEALLASPNKETRAGATNRALADHQLAVRVELSHFTGRVLLTTAKLTNSKAKEYLIYGVGRRLRMILVAYCEVFDTVAPDRKEPLPLNEMAAVSRDLNIIYINIRGALDNYAWCIYHEREMGKTFKWVQTQVGLFHGLFRNAAQLANLQSMLEGHLDWNEDLKSRRDPSAHRMPLYVPSAILNEGEAARHDAIWKERQEAIERGEYERDTELADEQQRLGTFRSQFLHDPEAGALPIYGTVPTDVGKLTTIGTAIHVDLVKP
jgi:hypothetical protein